MWLALLLVLALAGCGRWKTPTLDDRYQQARAEFRHEHYRTALSQADGALRQAPAGSPWHWRLRLLRVEILLEQRENQEAQNALNFEPPAGPQWTDEWTRFRICQASIEFWLKHPAETLARLDQAQVLAQSTGAASALDEIELRKARVAIRQSDFAGAESTLRRVLADATQRHDPYIEMKARGNLGFARMQAFRFEEAIPWFEEALKTAQSLGAIDTEARALLNRGWCYYRLGEFDKAQQDSEACAAKFESTGDRQDGHTCVGNIASALWGRHEYGVAKATYLRALDLATRLGDVESQAYWLNNLAKVDIDTGNWNSAEGFNGRARAIWSSDPRAVVYSTVNAGYIASGRKDFAKAEELFQAVIKGSADPVPALDAHAGLAHMFAAQGNDQAAEAEYRDTDTLAERRRAGLDKDADKLAFRSSLIEFYRDYVEFMMARGRTNTALEIAEASRARAMADRLSLARIAKGSGTAQSFQRLAAASGSVFLSYWLGSQTSYLWVVMASGIHSFQLPPESEVRTLVEQYDGLIQNGRDPLHSENEAGRKLFDMLIGPAREVLPANARIVLVPDGPLYTLNFETLPSRQGTPHYWIDDVTLSIAPSLGLLSAAGMAHASGRGSLLLVGNPVSPVPQYPALEFAGQEMAAIEKNLAGYRQVVLQGPDAERERYLRSSPGDFQFIHFVAHAVANTKEPLDSAVILSRHGDDYKLRASDVVGTQLQAELVSISACRSAGARIYAGEGLVGMAWAFLQAGARNVIAGLWDVNDRSTAELSDRLYAGLGRGLDPAEALRAAKLEMIHAGGAFAKPYYWAPFEVFTRRVR